MGWNPSAFPKSFLNSMNSCPLISYKTLLGSKKAGCGGGEASKLFSSSRLVCFPSFNEVLDIFFITGWCKYSHIGQVFDGIDNCRIWYGECSSFTLGCCCVVSVIASHLEHRMGRISFLDLLMSWHLIKILLKHYNEDVKRFNLENATPVLHIRFLRLIFSIKYKNDSAKSSVLRA